MHITLKGETIAESIQTDKLWFLSAKDVLKELVFSTELSLKDIHESNGHCSLNQLRTLAGNKYTNAQMKEVIESCETCRSLVNKTKLRKLKQEKESIVGEYISADIIGPINNSYGLLVTENKSSFIVCQILSSKSQATNKLIDSLAVFE